MAGHRVQHPSARRWAGLLVLLGLIWCTTGLARPVMAASHGMPTVAPMAAASCRNEPARPDGQAVAEPSCPMDAMKCAPSFQDRPPVQGFPLPGGLEPTPSESSPAAAFDWGRAPPPPASRGGPDLDQLCVSRT